MLLQVDDSAWAPLAPCPSHFVPTSARSACFTLAFLYSPKCIFTLPTDMSAWGFGSKRKTVTLQTFLTSDFFEFSLSAFKATPFHNLRAEPMKLPPKLLSRAHPTDEQSFFRDRQSYFSSGAESQLSGDGWSQGREILGHGEEKGLWRSFGRAAPMIFGTLK